MQPGAGFERKVVSVLFCDLVGFTAASEQVDPEDVAARLAIYHRMLRERVVVFGGTVEKFIGDAVMAVFGAPVAHEDDPERAVRAGLRILESIDDLNRANPALGLSVRIGINTGEAVVALAARPEAGEGFVTGDVVNTAARIQTAAPVNAVAVGEATYEATSRIFQYEPLDPVLVKGKSAPVRLWRAGPARARLGVDVLRSMTTPLVGRQLELLQLRTAFDRVARDNVVHLVTVTGEPGVGKSRLIAELARYVQDAPQLVRWRQGRCLPYGDGVTFWALGEIVKAHAGVLESDSPAEATAKLESVLPPSDDVGWLRARLLPLLGIDSGATASREESFAAWRRFIESLAESGPAVVVVEDIHWADEAMLAFLEHLAKWAQGVPLLILCAARPELFEAHPSWGAGLRNAMTIALSRLSDDETATLVARLLKCSVLPADTQRLILERAEGNPLYAEECVRALRDRDLIDQSGNLRSHDVPLPLGLRALIAARLDTLEPDRKALLADAAVIGRVFWADALADMGGRDAGEVRRFLHDLVGKELIHPSRQSQLAGQDEFAFWHAVVRDVAYGTIPRPARAAKHLAAARWLEEEVAGRVEDLAEILAHHSGEALALAQASGDTDLVTRAAPVARRHALLAADKALGLDAAQAMQLLDRALALTPDTAARPDVLVRWAAGAYQVGRLREAADALQAAADAFRDCGDLTAAGAALAQLGAALAALGDPAAASTAEESVRVLETQPPGPELIEALTNLSGERLVSGAYAEAGAVADRALSLAAELNLPIPARAVSRRGSARVVAGDRVGLTDLEDALALLIAGDFGHDAGVVYNNLGLARLLFFGPEPALRTYDDGIAFSAARGLALVEQFLRVTRLEPLLQMGRLTDLVAQADDLLPELDSRGDWVAVDARAAKARALLELGRAASNEAELALGDARRTGTVERFAAAAATATIVRMSTGDRAGGVALMSELASNPRFTSSIEFVLRLPALTRGAIAGGQIALARRLTDAVEPAVPLADHACRTAHALLAQAADDHDAAIAGLGDVAQDWGRFGNRLEEAYALLALGTSLRAAGAAPDEPVARARELFSAMGGAVGLRACDALVADAAGQTA